MGPQAYALSLYLSAHALYMALYILPVGPMEGYTEYLYSLQYHTVEGYAVGL